MPVELRTYRVEIIIFVIALGLRLLFLLGFGMEERLLDALNDQVIFVDMSQNLLNGQGFAISTSYFTANAGQTSFQSPGYIIFVAAVQSLFGNSLVALRLVQAVVGALTCVVAYRIGIRTVGRMAALIGAGILCVYLLPIMYVRPVLAETVFTLELALALLWTYRLVERLSILNAIIAAGLWAIAFLTRPEASLYGIAIAIYALFIFWRDHRKKFAFGLPYVLPGIVTFGLILSPWVVRNYQLHGEVMPATTLAGMNFWEANYLRYYKEAEPNRYPPDVLPEKIDIPNFDELSETGRDRAFMTLATDFIRQRPDRFVYFGLTRVLITYPLIPRGAEFVPPQFPRPDGHPDTAIDEFPTFNDPAGLIRVWEFRLLFICAIFGGVLAFKHKNYAALSLALLIVFNIAAAFVIRGSERARLFIDPYIILLAAYCIIGVYRRFRPAHSDYIVAGKPNI